MDASRCLLNRTRDDMLARRAPYRNGLARQMENDVAMLPLAEQARQVSEQEMRRSDQELRAADEAPEAEAERTMEVVRATMERAPLPALSLSVPLVVEADMGMNWAEAH